MKTVPQCANEPVPFGNENCIKYQSMEKLDNGKSYKILDLGLNVGDDTPDFIIGKDEYFFLGDNEIIQTLPDSRDRRAEGLNQKLHAKYAGSNLINTHMIF